MASGGTLALNQYIERDTDAIMNRTRHRPIPDKRIGAIEAFWFGTIATLAGLGYLMLTVNWLSAAVTAAIAITYLFAYTPLKRVSWSCNIVGAIPGALPPVAGWAAARGSLGLEPWLMFAIMFLWQLPHSLSIAKIYRADYKRAKLWLIPLDRDNSYPENPVIVVSSIILLIVGTLPTHSRIYRNHLPGNVAGARFRDAGRGHYVGARSRNRGGCAARDVRIVVLSSSGFAGDGVG